MHLLLFVRSCHNHNRHIRLGTVGKEFLDDDGEQWVVRESIQSKGKYLCRQQDADTYFEDYFDRGYVLRLIKKGMFVTE